MRRAAPLCLFLHHPLVCPLSASNKQRARANNGCPPSTIRQHGIITYIVHTPTSTHAFSSVCLWCNASDNTTLFPPPDLIFAAFRRAQCTVQNFKSPYVLGPNKKRERKLMVPEQCAHLHLLLPARRVHRREVFLVRCVMDRARAAAVTLAEHPPQHLRGCN